MLWAGSDVGDLYLGAHGIGLAWSGQKPVWQGHESPLEGLEAGLTLVTQRRKRWRAVHRPGVRLWLSGSLARPFMLDLPEGLKNASERRAWAEAQAAEATGLEGSCSVWPHDPGARGQVIAVAMQAEIREALLSSAASMKVRLRSVRPWWSTALDAQLASEPETELFAAEDTESLTLLQAKGGGWLAAGSYVPKASAQNMELLITRSQFANDVLPAATGRMRLSMEAAATSPWPTPMRVSALGLP